MNLIKANVSGRDWCQGEIRTSVSKEVSDRLASYGLPPHIITASTELVEALQFERDLMTSRKYVHPQEVSIALELWTRNIDNTVVYPSGYRLTSWVEYVRKEDWSPFVGA
ncbi:hypothetical protein ACMFMG_001367 [Clarireedia jacksonii]